MKTGLKKVVLLLGIILLLPCVSCETSEVLPDTPIPNFKPQLPDNLFCFREANVAYSASFSTSNPIYYNPIKPSTEFLASEYLLA
ncbi:MAG: hypothetical protein J6Z27_01350, partial [Bacteroidales bacterium]|nr:hypothetical protein [Bacteroidales bacterium]